MGKDQLNLISQEKPEEMLLSEWNSAQHVINLINKPWTVIHQSFEGDLSQEIAQIPGMQFWELF